MFDHSHGAAAVDPPALWTRDVDVRSGSAPVRRFPFVISQFAATEPGECELFVCLRRDGEIDPDGLFAKRCAAIAHVRGIVERRPRFARLLTRARTIPP